MGIVGQKVVWHRCSLWTATPYQSTGFLAHVCNVNNLRVAGVYIAPASAGACYSLALLLAALPLPNKNYGHTRVCRLLTLANTQTTVIAQALHPAMLLSRQESEL